MLNASPVGRLSARPLGSRLRGAVQQAYVDKRRNVTRSSVALQTSSRNKTTPLPPLLPLDGEYEDLHTFTDYANWLVPGVVMLGRYPFVEPSRCNSRDQGEAQLTQILQAGITVFVGLQEEIPPQHAMRLSGKDGFLPYKATADLILASFRTPMSIEETMQMRNATLNKFLPAKRRKAGANPDDDGTSRPQELQYLHYPIVDLSVPSTDQLVAIVTDLEFRVVSGEKLYVHCWGGRGRSGLVGACLLASLYNVSAREALERVQRAFDTRKDTSRTKSPETEEQIKLVESFVSGLARA